jgi:hypothetical protein
LEYLENEKIKNTKRRPNTAKPFARDRASPDHESE